ncbi:MAG: PfkB family carbohydrate kinase [Acidimicrobiales bacterium]
MESSSRFLCLDTIMIDIVTKVVAWPARGGDALSSGSRVVPGGGLNSMSAASRHGMPSIYVGRLGRGPFSDLAKRALEREGVVAPVVPDEDQDIGFCVVVVDAAGERTFITAPGAEGGLSGQDLEIIDVAPGDYVFLSGYNLVYPDLGKVVAPWVMSLPDDVVVALDPGPRVLDIEATLLRGVLDRTDWLLCNALEARSLTGKADVEAAVSGLLEVAGRSGVVVREGERGCVVAARGSKPLRVDGYSVEVIDTNGAGDTHNGVFLSELARGTALAEAAGRANAAAAMAIGSLGPTAAPSREEVSRWYASLP